MLLNLGVRGIIQKLNLGDRRNEIFVMGAILAP